MSILPLNSKCGLLLYTDEYRMPLEGQSNFEIGHNLHDFNEIAVTWNSKQAFLCRTFPGEVQAQMDSGNLDSWLIIPPCLEGRYTINNIHYVADGTG
jgi:hypothetical protein